MRLPRDPYGSFQQISVNRIRHAGEAPDIHRLRILPPMNAVIYKIPHSGSEACRKKPRFLFLKFRRQTGS
ncbi:hypothetical protein JOE11_000219 [Robbsia andropogonis]